MHKCPPSPTRCKGIAFSFKGSSKPRTWGPFFNDNLADLVECIARGKSQRFGAHACPRSPTRCKGIVLSSGGANAVRGNPDQKNMHCCRPGDTETFYPVAVRVGVLLFGAFFQGMAFELKWHPAVNAIFLVVWLVGTLSLTRLTVAYEPLSFSVPLKPLTPSLGVLATLHLMFSLGRGAYILFGALQVGRSLGCFLSISNSISKSRYELWFPISLF